MRALDKSRLLFAFATMLVGSSWVYALSSYGAGQITVTAWYEVWAPTIIGLGVYLYSVDLRTGYSEKALP